MSNDTIVGVVYIVMGIFGITENGLTAALLATDREMRNPTYIYMVNLCLCDMVELSSIAVYSGILLVYPSAATSSVVTKISSFVTAIGWYSACHFIILMTFSRYVQLKAAHKMHRYFKRRNVIITVLISWLFPISCFCWLLFYDETPFKFDANLGTWQFDRSQKLGRVLEIVIVVLISAIAVSINFFNIKTLLHVRRVRKQVHAMETHANAVREIKLFAQCAITGTLFTVAAVVFFVASALKDRINTVALVVAHCMWILNAVQYPFIYFALNSLLRERFAGIFCRKRTAAGKSDRRVRAVEVNNYVKELSDLPAAAPQ